MHLGGGLFSHAPGGSHLLALLLANVLLGLIPAAHVSPVDPTWIGGLYDDADHDDAVLTVLDGVGLVSGDAPAISRTRRSSAPLALAGPRWSTSPPRLHSFERAPPVH